MHKAKKVNAHRRNVIRLVFLAVAAAAAVAVYLLIHSHPEKPKLFHYILSLRIPTLVCMVIASISIGAATLIFQSIVHNRIVTPALLGMSSIYSFLHTAAVFVFGTGSSLYLNANLSFAVDLVSMGVVGTLIYWYLFRATGHNILYIMLIGTVLSSLFGSAQSAMIRVMDPNEYDALLTTLVADFNHVNGEIIVFAVIALTAIAFFLRKELKLLDVITMGRDQAINLGVDYDNVIRKLLFGVVLCMAVATATIGPVSFLGLIVANLSRQVLKTYKHAHLIVGASLMGMLALIGGQLISQHIFHFTVPVSTFVTIAGGVYFLWLLLSKKGAHEMNVQDLIKSYGHRTVVNEVSFEVPKGKVLSLIGPNGAGKSTVMGMISRLVAKDAGVIQFEGEDLSKWNSKELAKHLAILTQHNNVQMKLTVRELVSFGRFPYSGSRLTDEDHDMVDQAIRYMELEEFEDQYIDELSGGQRQRAYIAMVIAQDTDYVLLDEPTNNLDIYHASNLMRIARRLCDELGKTVILVLHEINYAAFYSDYICAFLDGKIAKFGPVDEVMTKENLKEIYNVDFEILNINGRPLTIYY